MTNGKKIGGLIALLAIPVAILLFLELFGQHHYDIPTDPDDAEGLSAEVPASYLGKPFSLNSLVSVRGESALVADIATIIHALPSDTDTARFVLEELTRVQDIFENNPGVQILTIVGTDQLDSLVLLSEQYRAQPGSWQFVSAPTDTHLLPQIPPQVTSAALMLTDQSSIRGYYDGMQEKEIDRLVAETRILLRDVK